MAINRHAVEVGVAVGLVDTIIFLHFLPAHADVRTAEPFNSDIEASERSALLATTAFTLLVAGFVRSWDTFLIAGAVIVGVDLAFKHANTINPGTGKMQDMSTQAMDMGNVHSLPDYADTGS
jgi:hypothetical protein